MPWQEDALKRIDALIQEGTQLPLQAGSPYSTAKDTVESAPFYGWRTKAVSALTNLIGSDHTYTVEFTQLVQTSWVTDRDRGVAILQALHSDVEGGYLRKVGNLISAEVFGDFLEMAQHLLDEGYQHPAASLTGAVLEDGLRRIARNHDITVSDRDDLTSLRDKCAGKRVFNNLVRQQITAWTTLRNSADHGKFNDYTAQQVGSMIADVRSFLANYLN